MLRSLNHDKLLSHSILVMLLLHTGSAANLLFHATMGRMLSPSEYGVLVSMLGGFFVFFMPLFFALQNTCASMTRRLSVDQQGDRIHGFINQMIKKIFFLGLPVLLIGLAAGRDVSQWLHLKTTLSVRITMVCLFVSLFLSVYAGMFQGLQAYVKMALASHGWTIVRLLVAVPAVAVISKANAALAVQLASLLVCALFCFFLFRRAVSPAVTTQTMTPPVRNYFLGSLAAIFFYSLLMNGDIIMVKLLFPSDVDYGNYARASVIGRMIVFLSQPVVGALFPKAVPVGKGCERSLGLLMRAFVISAAIVLLIAGAFSLFPQLPYGLLFGDFSPNIEQVRLVRFVIFGMSPLSLIFLIINFELAQNRFSIIAPTACFSLIFIVGFVLYHPSPLWVTIWLSLGTLGTLITFIGLLVTETIYGIVFDGQASAISELDKSVN